MTSDAVALAPQSPTRGIGADPNGCGTSWKRRSLVESSGARTWAKHAVFGEWCPGDHGTVGGSNGSSGRSEGVMSVGHYFLRLAVPEGFGSGVLFRRSRAGSR